jgi:hypothetical protein
MARYSRLNDRVLLRTLSERSCQDCVSTADLLELIAEVDLRRLFLGEGYSSMFAYCVGVLRYSEDVAYKRIRVARAARRFPLLFRVVAEGQVHVSGIYVLAKHLTRENLSELVAEATHKTKDQIEKLIRQRFPERDLPAKVWAIPAAPAVQLAPGPVEASTPAEPAVTKTEPAPGPVEASALTLAAPTPPPKVTPLSPQRFGLQLTIDQETHDLLREAQELLSHQIPSGNVSDVLRRVMQLGVAQLKKTKFAQTNAPRPSRRQSKNARYIPATVKRAVRQRDGSRCTFVSETGQRCESRRYLEFDHIEPVARGGRATVGSIRLLCRAHNQYEAERTFGSDFMEHKRAASVTRGGNITAVARISPGAP